MLSNIGRASIWRVAARRSQASSQHVRQCPSKLQRVRFAHALRANLQPKPIIFLRRSYAKTTEAATEPNASTLRPKVGRPAGRKAKTANPETKSKAKSKKKAVSKKRTRKPATEKQKARLQARKKRLEIKALKETALLSPPKKLAISAWRVLSSEYINGRGGGLVEASTKYKSLDASEREHYSNIGKQNKIANEAAFKEWVESHTPEQISAANRARAMLKRKLGTKGSSKYSPIPDSRLPKAPVNARSLYISKRFKSEEMKGLPFSEANKTIFKEWNELSPSEKMQFEDAAIADKRRYEQEYKSVFHHDLPIRKAATAVRG